VIPNKNYENMVYCEISEGWGQFIVLDEVTANSTIADYANKYYTKCTPLWVENPQSNVAFSLKSAHEMGRLSEKRCKMVTPPLPTIDEQHFIPFQEEDVRDSIEASKKKNNNSSSTFQKYKPLIIAGLHVTVSSAIILCVSAIFIVHHIINHKPPTP
jgi:hypothetical protein